MHIRYRRYQNVIDNQLKEIPEINSPRDYHVRAFRRDETSEFWQPTIIIFGRVFFYENAIS